MKLISVCALLSLLHCLAAQTSSSSSGLPKVHDSEVGLTGFEPDSIDGSPVTPPCEIFPLTDKQESNVRLDDVNPTPAAQTNGTTAAIPTPASTATTTTVPTSTTTTTTSTTTTTTTPTSTTTTPTSTSTTTTAPTTAPTITTTTPTTTTTAPTTTTTTTTTTAPTSTTITTTAPTSTTTRVRPVVPNQPNQVWFMYRLWLLNQFANAVPHNPHPRPHPIPRRPPHGGHFFRRPRFQSDSSEEH